MEINTNYIPNNYLDKRPVTELVREYDYQPIVGLVQQYYSASFAKDFLDKNSKLEELKNDIGEDLFASLSDEDRDFILKTEGSVDFGYKINSINLHEIGKILREDYEY